MDWFEIGVGLLACAILLLCVAGWIVETELKAIKAQLEQLKSQLVQSQQKVKDDAIVEKDHDATPAELDAILGAGVAEGDHSDT